MTVQRQRLGAEVFKYHSGGFSVEVVSESSPFERGRRLLVELDSHNNFDIQTKHRLGFKSSEDLRMLARLFAEAADQYDEVVLSSEAGPVSFLDEIPER